MNISATRAEASDGLSRESMKERMINKQNDTLEEDFIYHNSLFDGWFK